MPFAYHYADLRPATPVAVESRALTIRPLVGIGGPPGSVKVLYLFGEFLCDDDACGPETVDFFVGKTEVGFPFFF